MDTYTCFVSVTSIVLERENNHGRYERKGKKDC